MKGNLTPVMKIDISLPPEPVENLSNTPVQDFISQDFQDTTPLNQDFSIWVRMRNFRAECNCNSAPKASHFIKQKAA